MPAGGQEDLPWTWRTGRGGCTEPVTSQTPGSPSPDERTFLAKWVRNGARGGGRRHQAALLQIPPSLTGCRLVVVLVLVLFGGSTCALAWVQRWARVGGDDPMRYRTPPPAFSLGLVLAFAVVLLTVLLAVALAVD